MRMRAAAAGKGGICVLGRFGIERSSVHLIANGLWLSLIHKLAQFVDLPGLLEADVRLLVQPW